MNDNSHSPQNMLNLRSVTFRVGYVKLFIGDTLLSSHKSYIILQFMILHYRN